MLSFAWRYTLLLRPLINKTTYRYNVPDRYFNVNSYLWVGGLNIWTYLVSTITGKPVSYCTFWFSSLWFLLSLFEETWTACRSLTKLITAFPHSFHCILTFLHIVTPVWKGNMIGYMWIKLAMIHLQFIRTKPLNES